MPPPAPRGKRRPQGAAAGPAKRRGCALCREKVAQLDYKNTSMLRRYVSERGKIRPRRVTGACRRHQEQVGVAVRRAREMALLPYVSE
jgi:small subunit ribosomal protein S18